MFRTVIIVATVVAVILGSLGLPVYLHACQMKQAGESVAMSCPVCNPKPACPMCKQQEKQHRQMNDDNVGMKLSAKPCCTKHRIIQQTDPTVLTKLQHLPMPVLVAVALFNMTMPDPVAALQSSCFVYDRPPPLASRAQSTYLFNSTFLI